MCVRVSTTLCVNGARCSDLPLLPFLLNPPPVQFLEKFTLQSADAPPSLQGRLRRDAPALILTILALAAHLVTEGRM
jgi:hypothetical protein